MSTRNVLLVLNDTDSWEKLSDLITANRAAASAANLPTVCQSVDIISPETNADDSRLEITSDPVDFVPAYRLLKEESKEFAAMHYNNMSTMDKWIRLVNAAGDPIDGHARVVINYA